MDDGKNGERSRRQYSPPGTPLSVVSICLDAKSTQRLQEFASSTPLVKLRREVKDYLDEKENSPTSLAAEDKLDICLIDFDAARERATFTAERVHELLPDTTIFAISGDSQADLIIQAMRCGCSEYLLKPLSADSLLQAVARVAGRAKENQTNGQVLAFLGSKGGVGTTVTAAYLGAVLSRSHSRRTLLVDLHPVFGDAELYLGLLKYQHSFDELLANTSRLDADLLQSFVLRHESGLELLPAPSRPGTIKPAPPAAVGIAIDFLRSQYEYLLIDCPPGLGEGNLEALLRADQIYVIAVPEVAALRDVARYLDYFVSQSYPADKVRVVLNRCSKRDSITDEQITQAIHAPVFWKLPNQYFEVVRNINSGDPTSRSASSDLSRSFRDWAAKIASGAASGPGTKRGNKGLLAFLGS
jgi:pilus assembly protein CpaE